MRRRELLKWSAPIMSTTVLPVHAQTSCTGFSGPSAGTSPFNPEIVPNSTFTGSLTYAIPDIYASADFNWSIAMQPSISGVTLIVPTTSVAVASGESGSVPYELQSDNTVTVGDTGTASLMVDYVAVLGSNHPSVLCGEAAAGDTETSQFDIGLSITVV